MTKPKARTATLGVTMPAVIGHPNDVEPQAWTGHPTHAGPALTRDVADLIEEARNRPSDFGVGPRTTHGLADEEPGDDA